jgi:hypothetical protein
MAGAAGFELEDYFGLVHAQARSQPRVRDIQDVGAEAGQVAEQLGQRSRMVRQPTAER